MPSPFFDISYVLALTNDHTLGWDEGVLTMKVGEKATLDITRYDHISCRLEWFSMG